MWFDFPQSSTISRYCVDAALTADAEPNAL
jgi:hypothetical protein